MVQEIGNPHVWKIIWYLAGLIILDLGLIKLISMKRRGFGRRRFSRRRSRKGRTKQSRTYYVSRGGIRL